MIVSDARRERAELTMEHILFKRVYLKFLILRVRNKISYIALRKRMTIIELFATTIKKSYEELV